LSARLLIIDDEDSMREFLSVLFRDEGYQVRVADSATEARTILATATFDLVLCDILMPDGNGLDLLQEIKAESANTSVVMMTAYTSTKSAIEAMRHGAYDYVSKPFDVEELKLLLTKALEKSELAEENVYLRRELEQRYTFANIIGRSPRMQAIFKIIERIARTTSTVLVTGESGTGKELIARAIHFASPRSKQRFLSINCGALPENLLESELFGHERGAFTGAVRDKKGLLQERSVRRVGGNREEPVDVRIIAATNQNLEERVAEGEFREDLFYRINVIPIELPPLRARREDIPLLVNHFLEKYGRQMGIELPQISVEAMVALENHDWPGNVRELENLIERILAMNSDETITTRHLPSQLTGENLGPPELITLPEEGIDLEEYLQELRIQMMQQALERAEGVQTQAAELLGMSFRSFRYYAKKSGLTTGHTTETAIPGSAATDGN
jgi:two-component system response regulator PilR (NtrC family)